MRLHSACAKLSLLTILIISLFCQMTLTSTALPLADTSFIRELAKNKPLVVIVISGPKAKPIAEDLQNRILQHGENKHKPEEIKTLTISDLEKELPYDPIRETASYIWIIDRSEYSGEVPDSIQSHFPLGMTQMKDGEGRLRASQGAETNKGLAFKISLAAPDRSRLQSLVEAFIARNAPKYDTLPFAADRQTFKLATFSSTEDKEFAAVWGRVGARSEWVEFKWYPIETRDQMTEEQLSDSNQIYFINRSAKSPIPAASTKILDETQIGEFTSVVKRQKVSDTRFAAVFSSPNRALLKGFWKKYPFIENIPENGVTVNARDLRRIGRTSLLVAGTNLSTSEKETLSLLVGRNMRDKLSIDVQERNDSLDVLRREFASNAGSRRFVWQFTATQCDGRAIYTTRERRVSEEKLVPYEISHNSDDPEPKLVINSVGGGRKDEEDRKRPIFERDHKAWVLRKEYFEERAKARLTSQWEREILQINSASTKGLLRLIDLKEIDTDKSIVWELDCAGDIKRKPVSLKLDMVTIRAGSKPQPLDAPVNSETVPQELLRESVLEAVNRGISYVQENAWLTDGSEPSEPATVKPEPVKPEPVPAPKPDPVKPDAPPVDIKTVLILVADIEQGVVTITAGANRNIQIGDRAQVILVSRKITDPITGAVLSERILDSVTLRVTAVDDKTADCVPISAAEAAKLTKVTKGLPVKTWKPVPTKPPTK